MNNAFDDGHPMGETNDNVGQDTGNTQESSDNWEEQAKYFQSEKDKLAAENQTLKKYEQLGTILESRPDIVQTVTGMLKGGGQPQGPQQPARIVMDKDEFDPWEAYNDPQSKSYAFRQQELQESINGAVNQQMAGFQKQNALGNLHRQLVDRGLNEEQIQSFMQFASANPAQYGVDGAIKMWQAVESGEEEAPQSQTGSPYDGIRKTQSTPQPGGILDGQAPQVSNKTDADTMWDSVMDSGFNTGSKIP